MSALYLSHSHVLAAAVPVKDLDLQGSVHVAVAQGCHRDLGRRPDGIQGTVDLAALPHHRVATVLVKPEVQMKSTQIYYIYCLK